MALKVQDLYLTLQRLGLKGGDAVLLYASDSFARSLEGGAASVVDAAMYAIRPSGTLVCQCTHPSRAADPTYSVSDYLCSLHDSVVSSHPLYPVAAIGQMASEITSGHEKCHPFGRNSPFHRLYKSKAKLLLAGAEQSANTLVHLAEEMARLPYLDRSEPVGTTHASGRDSVVWVRKSGCRAGFGVVDELMEENADTLESGFGQFRIRTIGVREIIDTTLGLLSIDHEALLCDNPTCEACAEARAMISAVEAEQQDNEIVQLSEEEERTRINVEKRLQTGRVQHFERHAGDTSLN